ncbi:hypothetical protein QYF36_019159 [Acer negundo]|nr:hypothetical protein QYF36_019159 [Acer negundo]
MIGASLVVMLHELHACTYKLTRTQVGWPMHPVLHLFKQLQLLLLHRPYLFHKIKAVYPRQIHQQMLQIRNLASAFF